jgi:SAM-dependent methyltransferase
MLLDAFEHGSAVEIVEREDGFIASSQIGADLYLAPFRRWPAHQRRAMRFVRGRVLDIGAGGGRVAVHLQERGQEVVSIDVSPGAIEVCRQRGVKDVRELGIDDVDESIGPIDTIVMLGNNFGLFGSHAKAKRLLRRFHRLTTERGRIVAETRDVQTTDDPVHLEYQRRNVERGRLPGQIRIRVRYGRAATPWFDYLMVSRSELEDILDGTGWRLASTIDSDDIYVAVIDRV